MHIDLLANERAEFSLLAQIRCLITNLYEDNEPKGRASEESAPQRPAGRSVTTVSVATRAALVRH
ncbi:MAG: hypothetical protein ACLQL2_11330, partial [Methylovirgula sp.]